MHAFFETICSDRGARKAPVQAPDANAFAESWIGSLKRECLDHFICFSRRHLDHIPGEYAGFHNRHRPHQGLGNCTVPAALGNDPPPTEQAESDPIVSDFEPDTIL
mgnify:CR=1 FL=1|jgi:transposase InsO family protein